MSFLPLVLMATGTAMSAVSAVQEGQAQSEAAKANANVASMQAEQTRKAGAYEVSKIERSKSQARSTQQALYAKSGVLISEGSPIEVMADTATQYEMDIQAQKYNTAMTAKRYDYQAEVDRSMAKRYKQLGYTKAIGGTLLSLGTMAAGMKPAAGGVTGGPATTSHGIRVPSTYTPPR